MRMMVSCIAMLGVSAYSPRPPTTEPMPPSDAAGEPQTMGENPTVQTSLVPPVVRDNAQCSFPIHPQHHIGTHVFKCLNESISLDERRRLVPGPYNEINGQNLDILQPALAATTWKIGANETGRNVKSSYAYQGATYAGFMVERPAGYRAPIHYHEVPQLLCLTEGSVEVWMEGHETKTYSAPDCYMMPAYTKVCPLTLTKKREYALLRVPDHGYDWIVLEEKYYSLQTQWKVTPVADGDENTIREAHLDLRIGQYGQLD